MEQMNTQLIALGVVDRQGCGDGLVKDLLDAFKDRLEQALEIEL
jgi:hypothetical protein